MKNRMKLLRAVCLGLLLVASQTTSAYAILSSYDRSYVVPADAPGAAAERYEQATSVKFLRGLENFFLGWLEIPHGVKSEYQFRKQQHLDGGIEPFFIGLFRGTLNGAGRMAVGFYEGVTFLYPQEPILEDMSEWLY